MATHSPPLVSKALPLLGHALEFSRNPERLMRRGKQMHGDMFTIQLLNKHAVVVNGSELNKFFYLQTDKKLNINDAYGMLEAAFGQVLFIASNEDYENQRPLLNYVFSREKMSGYVKSMQYEVQRWLDTLGDSGEMDLTAEMQKLTQFVAGNSFLGADFQDELGPDFWDAYALIGKSLDPVLPSHWPLPKFRRRDSAKLHIRQTFYPMLAKRRQNPDEYDDLISQLLKTNQKDGTILDDETIISLFMGLIFAGHETTAGQVAWLVYEIVKNDHFYSRLKAEVDENVPVGTQIDGRVLRSMQQTYWAIDETTRLHPSAPLQIRTVKEDIELNGYKIPAGWLMMVNYANGHFDPEVWSDPERFDPDRWSPERKEGKNAFDIIGFGGGRHKCTGMNFAKNEMAVIAGLLFQQYELEVLSDEVHSVLNIGAARPSEILVRYQKKSSKTELENLEATSAFVNLV
ncbi:MAG: cytochrome P450 [Anaerolineae bacterium]